MPPALRPRHTPSRGRVPDWGLAALPASAIVGRLTVLARPVPVFVMKLVLVALFAVSVAVRAVPQGVVVHVDDARAQGRLGDDLLSLEEAIQIVNGVLAVAQLSPAELARVVPGGPVDRIEIDAVRTPTVTVDAALPALVGRGREVELVGLRAPGGARPAIAQGPLPPPRLLVVRAPGAIVTGFELRGGLIGVEVATVAGGLARPSQLLDCELHGQVAAAVTSSSYGAEDLAVRVADCALHDVPLGFLLRDASDGGALTVEGERLTFRAVARGADLYVSGSGGHSACRWWRCDFDGGDTFVQVRRSSTSTQTLSLRVVHGEFVGNGDVCDVLGNDLAETVLELHHARFVAAAGGAALRTWPDTGRFDVTATEMVFDGVVSLRGFHPTRPLYLHNDRFRGGRIVLDHDGSPADVQQSGFEQATIEIAAGSSGPTTWQGCELVSSTVDVAAGAGAVVFDGCYLANSTIAGAVTVRNPATSPWLGTTSVDDATPAPGSTVALVSWLPPGMDMVWDVGLGAARPDTGAVSLRLYMDPSTLVGISGAVGSGLRTFPVTVPSIAALVGVEFYFQGVAFPVAGQPHVPPVSLPIGVRVVPAW